MWSGRQLQPPRPSSTREQHLADLGNRGLWYRVRIGGFATHEEAQRFATEARSRAAAAGVQIKELQVTAYDKP